MSGSEATGEVVQVFGKRPVDHALKDAFLRWQCRVRQMAMREREGRPDDAIMPALTLNGASEPMGHIITLISKWGASSRTSELKHVVKSMNDPAQRRDKAIRIFSETWYQQAREFSDTLTATFPPDSLGAKTIEDSGQCTLDFDAYNQKFSLQCQPRRLSENHPLYQATLWHNLLFNPSLHPKTVVLAFEPDWDKSSATPSIGGAH